jgi:GNAT superfamily N-acetyltransferase
VAENATQSGFVIWSKDDGLDSVVGEPNPEGVVRAADCVSEILAFPENVEQVHAILRDFRAESATVFSAPVQLPPSPSHPCRQIGHVEIAPLQHLPTELLDELSDVAQDRGAIVAAFDGTLPVAFAYVASETEALWDISIDTIESHRRRGYAGAAVVHLMHLMKRRGKRAVWGALARNTASKNLAQRLGFVEVDTLWVLVRSAT